MTRYDSYQCIPLIHMQYDSFISALGCIRVCATTRSWDLAMQHTAPPYDTMRHTATHCNTLRMTPALLASSRPQKEPTSESNLLTPQHTATHCNTLQHTATHCNTLQHTAHDSCSPRLEPTSERTDFVKYCTHSAAHRNILQHTAHDSCSHLASS